MRRSTLFLRKLSLSGVVRTVSLAVALLPGTLRAAEVENTFISRIGIHDRATLHYLEALQARGRWVIADVGYVDFGSSAYRELYVGGGLSFHIGKVLIIQEALITRAFGPAAGRAVYLVPWTEAKFEILPKVRTEIVYFPYFPLNDGGRVHQVLERAKTEYDFRFFRLGAGYGGFGPAESDWQHKPFLTATIKGRGLGNFEFWLQKIAVGPQLQIRYVLIR